MHTAVASLACDERTARALATVLDETLDPDDTACAAFEDDVGGWRVAIHFRKPPDEEAVRALVKLAAGDRAATALTFATLAGADWVAQSLAGLQPVRAGRFVVHGAHDRLRVPANALGIEIEAALAFGTGHHGTTRGCLLALDAIGKRQTQAVRRHPGVRGTQRRAIVGRLSPIYASKIQSRVNPRLAGGGRSSFEGRPRRPHQDDGLRVLDIGTGSGVLAIAAAKRLVARVTASDIDRGAIDVARGNMRLNGVTADVHTLHAAGTSARLIAAGAPYDLIFANILLAPLVRLAAPIRKLAACRARVVLSGLLPGQANAVLAVYGAQGLRLERRIQLDGWVTLVLRR